MRIQLNEPQQAAVQFDEPSEDAMQFQHPNVENAFADDEEVVEASFDNATYEREGDKVGRNDPCPCGSGKKYKHCHGKLN